MDEDFEILNDEEEDMTTSELLKNVVEENRTRFILEYIKECKTVDEVKKKIEELLPKPTN